MAVTRPPFLFYGYATAMKLNVTAVLNNEAAKKAMETPLPKVKVKSGGHRSEIAKRILAETPPEVRKEVREHADQQVLQFDKSIVLRELNDEMRKLKKERAILSSRTFYLVSEVEAMLRKESEGVAREFLKGNVPMPELANHYEKIQGFTDRIISVFDKIRHVEQYNKLPEIKPLAIKAGNTDTEDIAAAKYEKDRLIDLISKTKKKLTGGKPVKNPQRKAMWNEKIALAEARVKELSLKIINLQYEARAERAGE